MVAENGAGGLRSTKERFWRFYPDQPFVRRAANAGREPSQDIGADAANVAILQDRVHVRAIGANHNLKWVLDR